MERNFLSVALVALLQHEAWSMVTIPLLYYANSLGASATTVGLLYSVLGVARLLAENPSGILVRRIGRKFTIMIGLVIIMLSFIIFVLAERVEFLFIAISMTGIGFVTATMGSRVLIADIAPPDRRASYMGIYQGITMSAGIVAPSIGGFVADNFGLRTPFLVSLFVTSTAILIALITIREPPKVRTGEDTQSALKSYTEILSSKRFLAFFIISFLGIFIMRFNSLVLPLYLSTSLKLSITQVSIFTSIASLATTLTRFSPLIRLLERYVSRRKVLIIGYAARSVLLYSLLFPTDFYRITLLRAFEGIIAGCLGSFVEAIWIDLTTLDNRSLVYGLRYSFHDCGRIISPILMTALMDINLRFPFYLVALSALIDGLVYFSALTYTDHTALKSGKK